jgi:hypothetical protein
MSWWPFGKKKTEGERPRVPTVHELCAGLPATADGRRLYDLIMAAEKAYDEMYEGRSPSGAYSDMKETMRDAVSLAREMGLTEKAAMLETVLAHRKNVFRSQMS